MKSISFTLLLGFLFLLMLPARGQRQEVSISPVGFVYPKAQLIHYERYVSPRRSWTASLSYNGSQRGSVLFPPPRTERFTVTRAAVGYRRYLPVFGDAVSLFGSVRAVIDYSALQLKSVPAYGIPADSLRAAGFSVAPELLLGGKLLILKRISLSGAVGAQHLFKLFSTRSITRNPGYWGDEYWTQDGQTWDYKRNIAVQFRQGWRPSFLITAGVILGKQPRSSSNR